MRFDCLPENVGVLEGEIGDLRTLPQLFRASPNFANMQNHRVLERLVRVALTVLTKRWAYVSIDTRLSMLMPGMYPCIPGWHCDDFYRPSGGNPDLENAPDAEHVAVVLGGCSLTRFVAEPMDLPHNAETEGRPLYGVLHKMIDGLAPKTEQVSSGAIVRFGPRTWHRGEAATEMGWRYFFRLTGSNHWTPLNQIRTQTQVYLTEPFRGW